MKNILVPVDFSEVTETVTRTAVSLARTTGSGIRLLHVKHARSKPDVDDKLHQLAASIVSNESVSCDVVVREGSVFYETSREAGNGNYEFVVIGTHGFKGIREVMFGTDIMKLLKLIPVPVITVLRDYQFPDGGFKRILFPVASHNTFSLIIDATVKFARVFEAEIHLFSIEKPGIKWSPGLTGNIDLAISEFKKSSVKYLRINEPESAYAIGFSRQTIEYARRVEADLIALMSVPSKEHFYFADGDKEQIITNKYNIPVISTSDRF